MTETISSWLKECSTHINILNMKKKDYIKKFDIDSKKILLEEMKKLLQKIQSNLSLINDEFDVSDGPIRTEFKGRIENNRFEYEKLKKEIDKLDSQLKTDMFQVKIVDGQYQQGNIAKRMDNNTQNLHGANRTANEIVERDQLTLVELKHQGDRIVNVSDKLHEVEGELTLIQQITDVMRYNDLFYRLKLYGIVVLLGFAIIIILSLKI